MVRHVPYRDAATVTRASFRLLLSAGAQWLSRGAPYTDGIVRAAAEYGATARIPSLWIYADNDRWFVPPLVARMLAAYQAAGAPAEFERVPAVGTDGHAIFTAEARRSWSAAAERFLASQGFTDVVPERSD